MTQTEYRNNYAAPGDTKFNISHRDSKYTAKGIEWLKGFFFAWYIPFNTQKVSDSVSFKDFDRQFGVFVAETLFFLNHVLSANMLGKLFVLKYPYVLNVICWL